MKRTELIALIAVFVLSFAYMIANRYQPVAAGDSVMIWVVDTWSGKAFFCSPVEARQDCREMPRR